MTAQPTSQNDDSSNLEFDSSSATAELDATTSTEDVTTSTEEVVLEWTGPKCEKCCAPLKSDVVSVCRECGWYASFGKFVEIDQAWEINESQRLAQPKRVSFVDVWIHLIPWWAWVLISTAVLVIAESVAARFVTPTGSAMRTVWSLTQLVVGLFAFVGCHIFNSMVAAADDADLGAIDMLLKPIKLWVRAAKNLPKRLWVANLALGSLTAIVMSIIVIGGLPYHLLWNWGIERPPEQVLSGAVKSHMKRGEGTNDIEKALTGGFQNLDRFRESQTPPEGRQKIDCVILGYRLDTQGRLNSLILGASNQSELAYAGYITPQLSGEELSDLKKRLTEAKTNRPFLRIQTSCTWVKPKFSCRVSYTKRSEAGRLIDIQWEEMLGEIRF